MTATATLDALGLDNLTEVGSWKAEDASTQAIYGGEGVNLSARRKRRGPDPHYQRDLLEVANLYAKVLQGNRRASVDFAEVMSTSDFAILFADIVDRQMLARYASAPIQWDRIARRGRVRDFRTVKRFTLDGAEATLDEVKQLAPYKAAALTDAKYEYAVKKYGRRLPQSWETQVNDDLDAFRDNPDRLAGAARRSEERFATDLYAGTTGPDTTFFASGNSNIVTGNPVLSIAGLQTAYQVLAAQLDTDGNPIFVEAVTLVVPPALKVTANNILNAIQIETVEQGGTANQRLIAQNWMKNDVSLLVNPWLPIISTTNGNTSWYLFASPGVGRPAMEVGFLTGHEQPELFMKSPNSIRIGGGLTAPEDGDFDTDAIDMKVRHVFGGTLMEPKSAVASNGTGS
jgi:hypothetical protein